MATTQIVKVVQVVEAVKRLPEPRRRAVTYFSENDVWMFQAVMDTRVCPICRIAEEIEMFRGNNLRVNFPYLEIIDENTIKANVHPNCRCYLVRLIL